MLAELVDEDAKASGGVAEAASGLGAGQTVDEVGRRASYWRWVALAGSRKLRARSVSFLGSLVDIIPKCHFGVTL